MNITILVVGKTNEEFVKIGVLKYYERIQHYINIRQIDINELKDKKSFSPNQIKEKETIAILQQVPKASIIVLLDENGLQLTSGEFAFFMQKQMNKGVKDLSFIIGGAFGVSEELKKRADHIISVSKMTFTHQFVRVVLAEQIYRAFTILRNEPYHNE
jgi:23S rRNA (pseudouridine1915-N3)-methyltransferase